MAKHKDLYDDEEIQLVLRKHPVVMRRALIAFMFCVLLGTVPSLIWPRMDYFVGGVAGGILLGILVALPSWIYWYFSVYILTDQRFIQITQKGFFKRSFADISLKQIQSINYHVVGIQETLLGFGTIVVQTYLGDNVIYDVYHPEKVSKQINSVLREYGNISEPPEDQAKATSHER